MKPLHELTASEALRERFDLEAWASSAASPTGAQLDCIQNGLLGAGHNGARADGSEDRRIRLMDLMNLTKHLNAQELTVCRLRYRELAQSVPYEKNRRMSDIMEGDGETVIDPRPLDGDGKALAGYVRVRGFKVKSATDEAVGERMGTPRSSVCHARGQAEAKVEVSLQALKLMTAMEDGES